MKKSLIFCCLTILISIAQSQNVGFKLKSGEIFSFKMHEYASEIRNLGAIDNHAYFLFPPLILDHPMAINTLGKNAFIYKCDLNNTIVKKTEIELKNGKKELQFEDAIVLNNKILVFSSYQNTREKKHYLFVQNFNPSTAELVDNIKLAAELDYSGFSKFNGTLFQITVSNDSTKVLIFYSLQTNKEEVLHSGINVYNNDMNLLWKNENVHGNFTGGVFEFSRFKVDNNGVVYLLGSHFENKSNYFDQAQFRANGFFSNDTYYTDMPNYTYELYRYSQNQDKAEHYSLSVPNKFIRRMDLTPDEDGNIFCIGLYSEPRSISVTGIFSFDLDIQTKTISKLNTLDIGNDLLTKDLSPEELKRFRKSIDNKQEWDPYDYTLSEIKIRKNGEKYFIAEQHIEGLRRETSSIGTSVQGITIPIYVSNDIFVVNLNKDNTFKRIDKISKRQFWLGDRKFNSYALLEKGNSLYFLYNTFEQKDAYFKKIEIGESYITRLDENGKLSKSVFKKKEDDKKPVPILSNAIAVTDDTILFGSFNVGMRALYQFQKLVIIE